MRKILSYLPSIVGVCVLVAIFSFFMHSNKAIEIIFISLLWLAIIILVGVFVFCIVLLTNKKTKVVTKTVILCIVNFIGVYILGFIYYLGFLLWKGASWQLITFGLPLLAGMAFLVIDTVIMFKNKSIKRGWRGFAFGWGALIITLIMTNQLSYLIIPAPKNGPDQSADTQENHLIQMLISNKESYWHSFNDFQFFLIQPQFSDEFVTDTPNAFDEEVTNITDHFTGGNRQSKYPDSFSY